MISQSRWDWIVDEVVFGAKLRIYLEEGELELIESILKNNTPFQVVPDHLVSNNNQQVDNVVLETKNFSVLGDKE